jgi:hypothetical protein
MTRETVVSASPEEVLALARDYFVSGESGYSAAVVDEGEGYVRFRAFRGLLAVSAVPEPEGTRVRCSTLRYHPAIGKFLHMLETDRSVPKS